MMDNAENKRKNQREIHDILPKLKRQLTPFSLFNTTLD